MNSRVILPIAAAILLITPVSSAAQVSTEVTLAVPVNLTQLGPDVAKVLIGCSIKSDAITTGPAGTPNQVTKSTELAVSGGQVVTTASLVFSLTGLSNPVGKTATIVCTINGWSTSQQSWLQFTPNAANQSFRITGSSSLGFLDASFVW